MRSSALATLDAARANSSQRSIQAAKDSKNPDMFAPMRSLLEVVEDPAQKADLAAVLEMLDDIFQKVSRTSLTETPHVQFITSITVDQAGDLVKAVSEKVGKDATWKAVGTAEDEMHVLTRGGRLAMKDHEQMCTLIDKIIPMLVAIGTKSRLAGNALSTSVASEEAYIVGLKSYIRGADKEMAKALDDKRQADRERAASDSKKEEEIAAQKVKFEALLRGHTP